MSDAYEGLPPRGLIELRFTKTYRVAALVDSMLDRNDFYISAEFSDYHGENGEAYAEPFQRWTALHKFVEFVSFQVMDSDFTRASEGKYVRAGNCSSSMCFASPAYLLAEELLRSHGLGTGELSDALATWVAADCRFCPEPEKGEGPDWDQIWEDLLLVEGVSDVLEQLSDEVFYVLFPNRTFLYKFNEFMASWLQGIDPDNPRLRSDRREPLILKRSPIPEWAKKAVFFRDRGHCCRCGLSLAATYTSLDRKAFDHMVPLASGGLNDITNLQLLCSECNRNKSAEASPPSPIYQRWFDVERPRHV